MIQKIVILVDRKWGNANDLWGIVGAIVRVSVLIAMFVALQSCGASWHLRRAIAKDPTIVADTIIRIDTSVVTESINVVDTLVVNDTIVREVVREGVQIKVQRIHDTIRVDVVCPPDTVRIRTEIPMERIIYKEQPMPLYRRTINIMYLILAVVVLAWIYRLTK
jgi:hypothetical protein